MGCGNSKPSSSGATPRNNGASRTAQPHFPESNSEVEFIRSLSAKRLLRMPPVSSYDRIASMSNLTRSSSAATAAPNPFTANASSNGVFRLSDAPDIVVDDDGWPPPLELDGGDTPAHHRV